MNTFSTHTAEKVKYNFAKTKKKTQLITALFYKFDSVNNATINKKTHQKYRFFLLLVDHLHNWYNKLLFKNIHQKVMFFFLNLTYIQCINLQLNT